MAYLYAHTLFGLLVRERLSAPLSSLLRRQERAFLLGLLGPDVYFFDRLPPPLTRPHQKRTANALHEADADTVFLSLLPLATDEPRRAYALGFLCHYALDCAVHPFVCAHHSGHDHTRYEMQLELPLCAHYGRAALTAVPPTRLLPRIGRDRALIDTLDALQAALAYAVAERGGRGVYRRSYRNSLFVHRLLYDPHGRKQRFLRASERMLRKRCGTFSHFLFTPPAPEWTDLFNEAHACWASPWDAARTRNESFFELFDAALSEAEQLLPLFEAACSGGESAALISLLKGGSMARGKIPHSR